MPSSSVIAFELIIANEADFEALHALRLEAMRESLVRIARFDEARSRARFRASFSAEHTRHVVIAGERVGFVAVKPEHDGWLLDHLYLRPTSQGNGTGSAVLHQIFIEADRACVTLRVGALHESAANRFYLRHGFTQVGESEFDLHYERKPRRQSETRP